MPNPANSPRPKIYGSVKAAYASHKTRDVAWRKKQLKQLGFMVVS